MERQPRTQRKTQEERTDVFVKKAAKRWMAALLALCLVQSVPAVAVFGAETPEPYVGEEAALTAGAETPEHGAGEEIAIPLDGAMGDESRDIPVGGITATAGDTHDEARGADKVLDGDASTNWHTKWSGSSRDKHWITLDLGKEYPVDGLRYLPRQSGVNGIITEYEVWVATEAAADQFVKVAAGNWERNASWKTAGFGPYQVRYVKLVAKEAATDQPGVLFASAAEIRVTQAAVSEGETYSLTSFTEGSHGGWQKGANTGTGTITFGDNMMELWAKGGTGNTAYYDAQSPSLADGYVQATITPVQEARFALLYRYTDSTHYTGISYDSGSWSWCANGGDLWGGEHGADLTQDSTYTVEIGKPFTMRVIFSGASVRVLVDGVQVAHGEISNDAISQTAGHMGFRLWGYGGDNDDTRGHIKVSAVEMGATSVLPLPEPEEPEVPVEPVDEDDDDGNYMVSFTDAARRGELEVLAGAGTVTFQDGEGEGGYAIVAKQENDLSKARFVVKRSPTVENGFLQADVTNMSGGRLGLTFRVKDGDNYVGMVYDVNGGWQITKNGSEVASFAGGNWGKGEKKNLRVEFAGTKVTVLINGNRVFSNNIDALAGTGAGKVGAIVWGYGTGDNQGKAKLDNVIVGQRVAVELSPEEFSMTYAEAGHTDMVVHLGETAAQNVLAKIMLGETELERDTAYTVSADGRTVTLKGNIITEEIRDNGGTELTFVFADGFEAAFRVAVHAKPQAEQIYYVRDFSTDPTQGEKPMQVLSGTANVSYDAAKKALVITNAQNAFLVDQGAPKLKNCDVEFTFNLTTDSGAFSALARYDSASKSYVAMGPTSSASINWAAASNSGSMSLPNYEDGNQMFGNRTVPYTVRVRFLEKTATVWVDHYEMWSGPVDCFGGSGGLPGIIVKGANMELLSFKVTSVNIPAAETEETVEKTIRSDKMSVVMDEKFPRVIRYTLDDKTLQGQELPYYIVELNNREYKPTVTSEFTASTATYHLSVEAEEEKTVTFDAVFEVKDNVLQMKLKNIKDSAYPLYNINFPVHSLVSVSSASAGAELRAANYSTSEVRKGLTAEPAGDMYQSASIVVISNNELAASINNESYQ